MDKFLIVVDMQNDFVADALGSDQARAIVPDVAARIGQACASGEHVWFTLDTHGDNYLNTQEGHVLPVPHCIKGQKGWQLVDALDKIRTSDMRLFEKPTFGSFALADALTAHARAHNLSDGQNMHIELCGVCTDICVVTNALLIKTALPEAQVSVQGHLCAGLSPERHEAALDVMRSCQVNVLA